MEWPETRYSLGCPHRNRVGGLEVFNVEEAVLCFEHALEVQTREAVPLGWVKTQ